MALALQQFASGTTTLVQLRDDSSNITMGLTTTGLTQAGSGNGLSRFTIDHTVTPTSADGDGVGLLLRTENASGTIKSVAAIDAIYDDISESEASLRFSLIILESLGVLEEMVVALSDED